MSKIAVVGDLTIDLLKKIENINVTKDYEKDNWELYFGYSVELSGGTMLLAEMIGKSGKDLEESEIFTYDENYVQENPKNFLHTIITVNKFKYSVNDECPNNKKAYRINYFDGFNFPLKDKTENEFDMELGIKKEGKWEKIEDKVKSFDMVLIHDHGNYFRNNAKYIEDVLNRTNFRTIVIHKMRFPLAKGEVWEKIRDKSESIKRSESMRKLIVIISADDLRENGLRISRSLSWERTACDLRRGIEKILSGKIENKELKELFSLKNLNLIIRFETDGAILYQNGDNIKSDNEYTLFFDSDIFEGTIESKYPGNMKSLGIAFTAGLVHGITFFRYNLNKGIKEGIKEGIIASRKLYEFGFISSDLDDSGKEMDYPFEDMFLNIDKERDKIVDVTIDDKLGWKIINQTLKDKDLIYQAACQIVRNGKSKDLTAPVAKYGKLTTADKNEIESYNSVKNLINEYLNKKNTNKPLSIAIFGPPGSGKSFGVTEIAKSISSDIEKLEFNLSQFQSPKDLFNAFHIIQSTSLSGKTPLVFFDEFDSKLNGENFGWLKYFLAPMNDGNFKQGDTIHPIGKCIFVFAGGTKKTFKEFDKDKTKAKGSDFVSRLRGYIDIAGINRDSTDIDINEESSNKESYLINKQSKVINIIEGTNRRPNKKLKDNHYMIRRAMVLRTILEGNAPNIFEENNSKKIAQIDDSVLKALIKVPNYKHGNRSMEAIIEMSSLSNKKRFDRSALPSSEQLQLHVDIKLFKKYLNEQINN